MWKRGSVSMVQDAIDWRINQKHEAFEEELRVSIYNKIRGSMESWRSDEQKAFNEDMGLNKKLVEILKKMEQASHHLGTFSESDLHTDLDKYLQANDMTGFYINRPYTDISPIIEVRAPNPNRQAEGVREGTQTVRLLPLGVVMGAEGDRKSCLVLCYVVYALRICTMTARSNARPNAGDQKRRHPSLRPHL